MSITAEQRDAWVAALRSGHYRQDRFGLHWSRPAGWCCLGVFANAVLRRTVRDMGDDHALLIQLGYWELPLDVQQRLARLNDSGVTFEQIADLLENAGDPALWA